MSEFTVAGHTFKISSVAGMGTCVCLTNWKIAVKKLSHLQILLFLNPLPVLLQVDMGTCPPFAVGMDHVFITHAHLDHLSALPIHAQQRAFLSRGVATYHLHPHLIPNMEAVLQGFLALDPGRMKYNLVPLAAPDRILTHTVFVENCLEEIRLGGGVIVRPFKTQHRVESQGYSFWKVTSTLKEEYRQLSSDEIREKIKVRLVFLFVAFASALLSYS